MNKMRSLASLIALTLSFSVFASAGIPRNVTRQVNNMTEVMNLDATASLQLQDLLMTRQEQVEKANNINDDELKRAERNNKRKNRS